MVQNTQRRYSPYINFGFISILTLIFIGFIIFSSISEKERKSQTIHTKKINDIKHISQYARLNYEMAHDNKITEYQAQENVKSYIKSLNNKKRNAIWVMNFSGFMHIHPISKLEHRNLANYQNEDNIFVFQKITSSLKLKQSLVLTQTFPTGTEKNRTTTKRIYAQKFKPWGWIFVSEIPLAKKQFIKDSFFIVSIITIILVIAIYLIYIFIFHHQSYSNSKKLLETEKKYQALFDSANDGILLIEKYRFIDCNPKALELFKATKSELIGASVDQFSPKSQPDGKNSYDQSIDLIDNSLNNKRQFFEWVHQRTDGITFNAEVSVNKIKVEKREMLLAIVRDTTARKNLERKLIAAKNKAEESDRLKSAFLANTSHEIRTPMNAIVGFSKLLQSGQLSPQKQKEYTKNILEKGNQLLQIINDIIDVSKIEANQLNINKTRFSLNKLFDEIQEDFRHEIDKNEHIHLQINKEIKNENYIFLDKTRVKQILSNLLSNAFKYTDRGKIETGYKLLDKDNILFFVRDTGIGVDKNKQNIIFDSFRKSDKTSTRIYGGTGLGLSISKALVDLMGGKIWVESELNQGATFYFTLPYEPAHVVNDTQEKEEEPTYNWEGKNILVVEDDELSFEYLKEILKVTHAKISCAKDGQAAIDQCKNSQDIDLVLMDIQLPGIDGNTATKKIREFNKTLPIIAQTAYALEEERNKILQSGCNDYVSKPINEKDLYKKIHHLLD